MNELQQINKKKKKTYETNLGVLFQLSSETNDPANPKDFKEDRFLKDYFQDYKNLAHSKQLGNFENPYEKRKRLVKDFF
jgi:hypothetical protein